MNTLDIAPPKIQRGDDCESSCELLRRQESAGVQHFGYFVDHAAQVLAGTHGTDRTRQDVVEDESRDGQTSKERAHGIPYNDVNTAAHVHAAAFHVDRTHREAKQHDTQDKPWRTFADSAFSNTTGVKSRRCHVAENDRGSTPKGNEREHDGAGDNDSRGRRPWIFGQPVFSLSD